MPEHEPTAPPAGIEQRKGFAVGSGGFGLLLFVVAGLVSSNPVETLTLTVVCALTIGVINRLSSRKDAGQRRPPMDRVTGTDPRRGFSRGLVQAAVLATFLAMFTGLMAWTFGPEGTLFFAPAFLLGNALWVALEVRARRREESGAPTGAPL